jgi:hypothetical protein
VRLSRTSVRLVDRGTNFMNRLLIVGILITSTMPLSAQGQQPELEKTLGPEYLALVKALENMDPTSRDTVSRHAFRRQCWQLKVLRQKWN